MEKTKLTKREKEIVLMIYRCNSNKKIAEKLSISYFTLRKHLNNIYQKTKIFGDKSIKKIRLVLWYLDNKDLF